MTARIHVVNSRKRSANTRRCIQCRRTFVPQETATRTCSPSCAALHSHASKAGLPFVLSEKHAEHLKHVKRISHAYVQAQKAARRQQQAAGSWWVCPPKEFSQRAVEQWPRMAVQQVSLPIRIEPD
jgi:hypothetical protein